MKQVPVLIALGLSLAACQAPREGGGGAPVGAASAVTLTGTALYRERIALPPDARLTVEIRDVSRMDAPAPLIAQATVDAQGRQVPIPFSVAYDPARIEPQGRYAVSARITQGEALLWITDTHTPLPPAGTPVELRLVRAGR